MTDAVKKKSRKEMILGAGFVSTLGIVVATPQFYLRQAKLQLELQLLSEAAEGIVAEGLGDQRSDRNFWGVTLPVLEYCLKPLLLLATATK